MKGVQMLARSDESCAIDPYRQLAMAILRQAVTDAAGRGLSRHPEGPETASLQSFIQSTAWDFLTDKHGDLTSWLDLLDVNAEQIQRALIQAVRAKHKAPPIQPKGGCPHAQRSTPR